MTKAERMSGVIGEVQSICLERDFLDVLNKMDCDHEVMMVISMSAFLNTSKDMTNVGVCVGNNVLNKRDFGHEVMVAISMSACLNTSKDTTNVGACVGNDILNKRDFDHKIMAVISMSACLNASKDTTNDGACGNYTDCGVRGISDCGTESSTVKYTSHHYPQKTERRKAASRICFIDDVPSSVSDDISERRGSFSIGDVVAACQGIQ